MGTNLESSQMILRNLYDENWLNNQTDVIMFEQTYFNGYINSFLMLRVSFEHVSGGAYHGQLRLKVRRVPYSRGRRTDKPEAWTQMLI